MKNGITNMCFPTETQKILNKIENSIKGNPLTSVGTIPSLLIEGDNYEMNNEFAKLYEGMLLNNNVYPIHGNKTYLNLVFPKNGTEEDYKRFLQSPKIASCTQNNFYGVFNISFEEWEGKELLNHDEFTKLLSFIDDNKETMNFVFSVESNFKQTKNLKDMLSNHLVLETLHLENINLENATGYIKSKLNEKGIIIRPEASRELKNFIETKVNINSPEFNGYYSLNTLADNLMYELNSKFNHEGRKVTEDMIKEAGSNIYIPDQTETKYRIGF